MMGIVEEDAKDRYKWEQTVGEAKYQLGFKWPWHKVEVVCYMVALDHTYGRVGNGLAGGARGEGTDHFRSNKHKRFISARPSRVKYAFSELIENSTP